MSEEVIHVNWRAREARKSEELVKEFGGVWQRKERASLEEGKSRGGEPWGKVVWTVSGWVVEEENLLVKELKAFSV